MQVDQHPELSHQEHRTATLVADRLRAAGYEVHEGVGGTGVVGLLRNGEGPAVLLRADMDALPVREATGLPHASEVTSTDADGNEVPVMHACGHDVHVSCLAGAAQLLADGGEHWAGTVITVFQPAEETGDGARGMVEDGLGGADPATTGGAGPAGDAAGRRTGRYPPRTGARRRTACGSPCTGGAPMARCRRPRSIRWCWPR